MTVSNKTRYYVADTSGIFSIFTPVVYSLRAVMLCRRTQTAIYARAKNKAIHRHVPLLHEESLLEHQSPSITPQLVCSSLHQRAQKEREIKAIKQWARAFFREDLRYRKCEVKPHPSPLVVNGNGRKRLSKTSDRVTQRMKFHQQDFSSLLGTNGVSPSHQIRFLLHQVLRFLRSFGLTCRLEAGRALWKLPATRHEAVSLKYQKFIFRKISLHFVQIKLACARSQASAAVQLTSSVFWVITRCKLV